LLKRPLRRGGKRDSTLRSSRLLFSTALLDYSSLSTKTLFPLFFLSLDTPGQRNATKSEAGYLQPSCSFDFCMFAFLIHAVSLTLGRGKGDEAASPGLTLSSPAQMFDI
jgi:hypothetical protein